MIFLCTKRLDYVTDFKEYRESVDTRLTKFFLKLNIKLLFVSMQNSKKELNYILKYLKPKGIVISGGNDLNRFKKRDLLEKRLIEYGIKNKLPIIGICRGMQIIASSFGAKLKKLSNHVRTKHIVKEEKKSKKRKDKFIVNSFHKYGLCKTPPNFIALYKAEDNSIEAIKHNRLPILGIMWHPERFKIFRMKDIKIIKSII
tara:strand:- start:713 stop:1315 length:603 start_codon:yes stop_codon:yes gene_type:complete